MVKPLIVAVCVAAIQLASVNGTYAYEYEFGAIVLGHTDDCEIVVGQALSTNRYDADQLATRTCWQSKPKDPKAHVADCLKEGEVTAPNCLAAYAGVNAHCRVVSTIAVGKDANDAKQKAFKEYKGEDPIVPTAAVHREFHVLCPGHWVRDPEHPGHVKPAISPHGALPLHAPAANR